MFTLHHNMPVLAKGRALHGESERSTSTTLEIAIRRGKWQSNGCKRHLRKIMAVVIFGHDEEMRGAERRRWEG
jgi:hypothetical protein